MQRPAPRPIVAALACALLSPASLLPSAGAETLSEASSEARTYLYFQVPEAAAQQMLPAGWQASPAAAGPARGANLVLVFLDRLLLQDAQGRPVAGGTGQSLVLFVPARNPAT